jgi:hypothetical protein
LKIRRRMHSAYSGDSLAGSATVGGWESEIEWVLSSG